MHNYLLENVASECLHFRKIKRSDFDTWLPFYHNPLSTKYWDGLPQKPQVACQEQFDKIFERYEKKLGGMNALLLKETNEFIGMCGLLIQHVDGIEELEIGYSILPKHWRNGYAIEAARQCKHFTFKNLLSKSLISIIHIDNIPSQKVALKNGMYLDKTTRYKNNPVHIFRIERP